MLVGCFYRKTRLKINSIQFNISKTFSSITANQHQHQHDASPPRRAPDPPRLPPVPRHVRELRGQRAKTARAARERKREHTKKPPGAALDPQGLRAHMARGGELFFFIT